MIKSLLLSAALLFSSLPSGLVNDDKTDPISYQDSKRLAELDQFWEKLSKTVKEGDFEGYGSLYHEDAIVVFATGKKKTSVLISKALADWKQGFDDTKAGKQKDNVTFRFSQRIGNGDSAHETGMFMFTSSSEDTGRNVKQYVHFEMLLVKKNGKWLGTMEYQKSMGTEEAWNAMK